jgi:hypothetical protein
MLSRRKVVNEGNTLSLQYDVLASLCYGGLNRNPEKVKKGDEIVC